MAPLSLQPSSDRLVVERIEEAKVTPGGIALPDTVDDTAQFVQGRVLKAGPGRVDNGILVPMQLKVGDKILFNRLAIMNVKVSGLSYLVINERDVLGVLV